LTRSRAWPARATTGVALCVVLLLRAASSRAQPPVALRLERPSCASPWLDARTFDSALRTELAASGIVIDDEASDVVAVDGVCGEGTFADVTARRGDTSSTRRVELTDVVPASRARTLALAVSDFVRELSEPSVGESAGVLRADADRSAPPPMPALPSRSRAHDRARDLGAPDLVAPDSIPSVVWYARARFSVASVWVPSGGGELEVMVVVASPSFAMFGGVAGQYARTDVDLGAVEGGWGDVHLGARGLLDLGGARLGLSADLAAFYARIEGHARSAPTIASGDDAVGLAVDVAALVDVVLDRVLRLSILAGFRAWPISLAAVVGGRSVLAFEGLEPFVSIGAGVSP